MGLLDTLQIAPRKEEEFEEEFGLEFDQDPAPSEAPAKRRSKTPAAAKKTAAPARRGTTATKNLAKEVAEDLATLLEGTAAVWGLSDQCCAPTLEAQARPIADALTAILARNPRLLAKFANTDIVAYSLQSVALGKALLPVGKAVYKNHVSKAVEDDEEGTHNDGGIQLGNFPAYRPRV